MGNGAGKKAKNANRAVQVRSPPTSARNPVVVQTSRSSPVLSPVLERTGSVHSQTSSVKVNSDPLQNNQGAIDHNFENLRNGINHDPSANELINNSPREDDDFTLPPMDNLHNKSKSAASIRDALPNTRNDYRRESLVTYHGHAHHYCSHCSHCKRKNNGNGTRSSTPIPKWLTEKPGRDQFHIKMDDYDIEAVKKKTVAETGHLPGSYDYRPRLIMDSVDDYDSRKENYYTQPVIAKITPFVSPARTPFPEYNVLQRKERRVNKPFTSPLFV